MNVFWVEKRGTASSSIVRIVDSIIKIIIEIVWRNATGPRLSLQVHLNRTLTPYVTLGEAKNARKLEEEKRTRNTSHCEPFYPLCNTIKTEHTAIFNWFYLFSDFFDLFRLNGTSTHAFTTYKSDAVHERSRTSDFLVHFFFLSRVCLFILAFWHRPSHPHHVSHTLTSVLLCFLFFFSFFFSLFICDAFSSIFSPSINIIVRIWQINRGICGDECEPPSCIKRLIANNRHTPHSSHTR